MHRASTWLSDAPCSPELRFMAMAAPTLEQIHDVELLGVRAGQPTLRLVHPPLTQCSRGTELCADSRGVDVHAMVAFDAS
jgi:hypothetical protein